MRLNRLDLIRYGRFDDAEIVLPRPVDGNPDVTVIYGPNESGKSTAFEGFLELLYGMKSRDHPYAFRFNRSDLLVGAELDIPGHGAMILRRNGKLTQSLLDEQDRPIADIILSSALYGLGKEDYVERFSLNDTGLREGGKRIAGAKGDLGQLLHAGVSGLTNMAETLEAMTARAEQFHKKNGRSTALKIGKDRLTEIGGVLKSVRLSPDRERSLREDRDVTLKAFKEADAELSRARNRQAAGKAAQTWYDQSEEIRKIDAALAGLPDGPNLKKGIVEHVATLVEAISGKNEGIADADNRIARHEKVIAENEADPAAMDLVAQLTKLEQIKVEEMSLIWRADTIRSDTEKRILERDEIAQQIKHAQFTLQVPDVPATSLVLTSEQLENLGDAAQACHTSDGELKAALEILKTARDQLGDAPAKPQDLSQLQVAFDAWQAVADVSGSEQTLEKENTRLMREISGLPASWTKLVEDGLPAHETLDEVLREWTTLTSRITAATEELEVREAEYKVAHAKRKADEGEPSSIDAAATEETRRRRDAAWHLHRNALSDETADRFEEAMQADDGVRSNYLMGTEARKQLAVSRTLEATAEVSLDAVKDRLGGLIGKRDDLSKRVASLAAALGLYPDTGPAAFAGRLSALSTAAEIAADVVIAKKALEELSNRRQVAFDNLSSAARLVEIDVQEKNLPELVGKSLTLQDSVRQAWEKWCRGEQTVAEHEKAVAQAEEYKRAALTRLEMLTAALPIPDCSATSIKTALPHLRTLQQFHREHESLVRRVDVLERAEATLAKSVVRLAEFLDVPFDPKGDPLPIIDRARTRVTKADNSDRLRKREEDLLSEEKQSRTRAIRARDEAQETLEELFKGQGGDGVPPTERTAGLVERDNLREKRGNADKRRNEARDGVEPTLFDEELAHLPNTTREAELQQELDDSQTARDAARDLSNEKKRHYDEAYRAADNSELVTEQATILEELRSGARRAAVARLGILAARGALRRLASERRSTMLKDVEEAFVTMTSKEWEKVVVWSETEGEKLVGIKSGGDPVPVEHMSTGTMGQLYFALRLAGYRSFTRALGPLPMILDDILETFDDARASAALKLCAEIGRSGQSIIFTHHAHLLELARKNIPSVSVVEMPD
ncbi:MAG: AAA family ATPase [Thalassospira sp.]|uniref:AAA family ATPase n=1 Tax=Thalassospira sp. TaxID=1912094 RepID=UPI0032F052B4